MSNQLEAKKIALRNALIFRKDLSLIRKLVKPTINDAQLREWVGLRAVEAASTMADILNVPFCGSGYNLTSMAVHHNVTHGLQKIKPKSQSRDEIVWANLFEAGRKLLRIAEITPMVFRWKGGAKARSRQINNEFAEVFSWQF